MVAVVYIGNTEASKVKLFTFTDSSGPPLPRLKQRHLCKKLVKYIIEILYEHNNTSVQRLVKELVLCLIEFG